MVEKISHLNCNLERGLRAVETLSFICSAQWEVEKGSSCDLFWRRRNFNGQFFRFLWPAEISSKISNTPNKLRRSQTGNVLFDQIGEPFH